MTHKPPAAAILADLPPDRLVAELLPTMFTDSAPAELVEEFAATLREFHPVGIRANSHAFAEADLRDVLPHVAVRTLLLCGQIPGSRLVVIPGAGHVCNIDAPERFNTEVRAFLRAAA